MAEEAKKSNPVLGSKPSGTLAVMVILQHCQEETWVDCLASPERNNTSVSVAHTRQSSLLTDFWSLSLWK